MTGARILRTDDWDEDIEALDRACFLASEAIRVDVKPEAARWIALAGDIPIGYAVAYAQPEHGGSYLDRYGVLEEYSGRGLGKRLIRAWLGWARRGGAAFAWTYTVPKNAASINALCGCGFRAWRPAWGDASYCIWRREL